MYLQHSNISHINISFHNKVANTWNNCITFTLFTIDYINSTCLISNENK